MASGMYEIISRKRDGQELKPDEIAFVISGYVKGEIPDYQMAALLMAVYIRGLSDAELSALTEDMLHSGACIDLGGLAAPAIDKHSTGGVGDKISFVVAPLAAACGVVVPMLSGRGLGHTGGTLDKLESIPGMNVFLTEERFREVLQETGMVICGQTDDIVPADKKIYALRDATATVASIPLIASSIMSKKLALGTDGIVLDVKTGSGAFMVAEKDAVALCQTMVRLGERADRRTLGLITSMDQPLGRAVGNSLEMIESIQSLKGEGPADVMQVAFALGHLMLEAAGLSSAFGESEKKFRAAIASGRALDVFRSFIKAQGGDERVCDDYSLFPGSKQRIDLPAAQSGWIQAIDAFAVGLAGIDVRAGRRRKEDDVDHGSGFIFHKNVGDQVEKGEPIAAILTNDRAGGEEARERIRRSIVITRKTVAKPRMVLHRIDRTGVHPWNG